MEIEKEYERLVFENSLNHLGVPLLLIWRRQEIGGGQKKVLSFLSQIESIEEKINGSQFLEEWEV